MGGKLYMIGSPIGNLGDISSRATEVLKSLDRLYCEDTRVTGKLLAALGIKVPLKSLSDDSPAKSWIKAIDFVEEGNEVGFITDAGMPGLSDPGRKLIRLAWEQHVPLSVIPGPSSVGSLIALCPFISNQFSFLGFAPRKQGEIESFINVIAKSPEPIFFFDSPKRVHNLLEQLCAGVEPSREVLVGREMTKLYEQVVLLQAQDWADNASQIPAKGEFTIAVAGSTLDVPDGNSAEILEALARLEKAGFSKRDAAKAVAAAFDIGLNVVKKAAYPQ